MGTTIIDEVAAFLARRAGLLPSRGVRSERPRRSRRGRLRPCRQRPADRRGPPERVSPDRGVRRRQGLAPRRQRQRGRGRLPLRRRGVRLPLAPLRRALADERHRRRGLRLLPDPPRALPGAARAAAGDPRVLHAGVHRPLPGQGLRRRALDQPRPRRERADAVQDPRRPAADTRAGRRLGRDLDQGRGRAHVAQPGQLAGARRPRRRPRRHRHRPRPARQGRRGRTKRRRAGRGTS